MRKRSLLLPLLVVVAVGCAQAPTAAPTWTSPPGTPTSPVAVERVADVYKSPTCSCCHEWEAYLRGQGYTVRSFPTDDMVAVKTRFGVPDEARSCHTAVIDGYVVEGHVPIEAIEDLLRTRPAIDGIALPGMPPGSPGMPGDKVGPFEILALDDGQTTVFGSY